MSAYWLYYHKKDWIGVGECLNDEASFELLYSRGRINDWKTLWFRVDDGAMVDYQPNDLAFALCSQAFRECIESNLKGNEALSWLPAVVRSGEKEEDYWVLHVERRDDVLSYEKSIFSGDHLIKAVLDKTKVADLNAAVFAIRYDWVSIYVTEGIKTALSKARLSGVKLIKAPEV